MRMRLMNSRLILFSLIILAFVAGCVQSDDKAPVSPTETPFLQPSTDVTEYVACGCGCCGGVEETVKCLYRSKGDDIQKIIDDDKKAAQSPDCEVAGCSQPVKYVYCDEQTNTETNNKSKIKSTTFSVFQEGKTIPRSIDNVDIPLTDEEICIVARKSCNSPSCSIITKPNEPPEFGQFDWLVVLEPVCGHTAAYINENEKSVVCSCAYE